VKRRIALSIPHFMSVPFIIMESDLIVAVPLAVGRSFARMTNLKMFALPIGTRDVDLRQHWHTRFHRDPVNGWLRGLIHAVFGEDDRPKGKTGEASGTSRR
jgi:hypothetical protein